MNKRQYYTLVVKENGDTQWSPQFGDYNRAVVAQEMKDMQWGNWPRGTKFKIIATGDSQADINAGVAALNGGTCNAVA